MPVFPFQFGCADERGESLGRGPSIALPGLLDAPGEQPISKLQPNNGQHKLLTTLGSGRIHFGTSCDWPIYGELLAVQPRPYTV
jgi:hypothetical protein